MKYYTIFAQAYGENAYGECVYSPSNPNECTTAPGGTSPGNNAGSGTGGLAGTGVDVILIISIACLLIFVGLVMRIWRRRSTLVAQEIDEREEERL